ncbi:MAG TPA: lipocalin-like domain-containing protein [Candidatus Acidoferrales bacterium]|nr:lipocalin-like domain-containing protein [Candidatus Acidoferrales bacterium]
MRVARLALAACLLASAADFREALPGYHYQFPRDHFDHPGFRTEWWYYTGNLHARDGHRYGFELVFFRSAQSLSGQTRAAAEQNPSVWRVDNLYLGHLALTDIDNRRFRYAKRLNRAGPGIAGASFEQARIWNGNWEARWNLASGAQTIAAVADGIRFNLHLTPAKAPIINGENGISQKAEGAGKASYYVSFPRLAVEGVLNGVAVTGLAWMDHEWFTHQLEANQQGWDWFSVQLDTGAEFMLFQLRHTDGSIDAFSSGTYIAPDGRTTHLKRGDFELQPIEYWTSPKTSARYPVRWRVSIPGVFPGMNFTMQCAAAIPDQELVDDPGPTYWEGAVTYTGSASGVGYLEMTGYTKPMRL